MMQGKKFMLLLVPTRECPLTTKAIWTYSHLVYRSRCRMGATKSELQDVTGLHWKTITTMLPSLLEHQLVEEKNGLFFAKDDPAGVFYRKKENRRSWQNKYQTVTVYLLNPEQNRLTFTENLVLWLIHSYNAAGMKVRRGGIATQLKIAKDTAKRAVKRLRTEGLLDDEWNLTIGEDARAIWADQPQPEIAKVVEQRSFLLATRLVNQIEANYIMQFDKDRATTRDGLKDLLEVMEDRGYTSQQIEEFFLQEVPEMAKVSEGENLIWSSLFLDCYLNRCLWQTFKAAEQFTARNRKAGKYHGRNSLGVFRKLSHSVFRLMKARHVDEGVDGVLRISPQFDEFLGHKG